MNRPEKNTFHYGLALLKAFMCFIVVLCHCWTIDKPLYLLPFSALSRYPVPVFMFISFYLTQKSFVRKDKGYAAKRLWKLIFPQILWAGIYFVVYWVADLLINGSSVRTLKDLLWQIFTGHSPQLNPTMWYQTALIVITAVFFVIFYWCSEKVGIIIISILSAVCLILQYSEINYMIFGTLRYELSYPLGRIVETLPVAASGFVAAKYNLLTPRRINKAWTLVLSFALSGVFLVLDRRIALPANNFSYAGIFKIAYAYAITVFAFNLNFDFLGEKGKRVLAFITKHTQGIYCGHRLFGFFVFYALSAFLGVATGNFYQCILIYIVGFILCWAISKIPFKWIKSLV